MIYYDMKDALEKIKEICESFSVPIVFYNENDFPDGRQTTEDVISISKSGITTKFEPDYVYFEVKYFPWIRVMPRDLELEDFDKILDQGKRVRNCVSQINDFFADKRVRENT